MLQCRMAREIKRAAPTESFDQFIKWIDDQTENLIVDVMPREGCGRQQVADMLGVSRMQLHRVMNEKGNRLSAGRKVEIYLRLLDWLKQNTDLNFKKMAFDSQRLTLTSVKDRY